MEDIVLNRTNIIKQQDEFKCLYEFRNVYKNQLYNKSGSIFIPNVRYILKLYTLHNIELLTETDQYWNW